MAHRLGASQSKGVCNETYVRPGRAHFGAIGSPGHSRRPPRDSTAQRLIRGTHVLPRPQWAQYRGAGRGRRRGGGSNIVEPAEAAAGAAAQSAKVVNLASWSADDPTGLELHEPEATDIVITFESRH